MHGFDICSKIYLGRKFSMFNHKHYIPILRWKGAERGALNGLSDISKDNTTPLVEFIMPNPSQDEIKNNSLSTPKDLLEFSRKKLEKDTPKMLNQIINTWGKNNLFVDVHLIDSLVRAKFLTEVLKFTETKDLFLIPVLNIIPVVSINTDKAVYEIVAEYAKRTANGLCIRIVESNLKIPAFADVIHECIDAYGLNISNIDVIVDYKIVDNKTDILKLIDDINRIPVMKNWRTFTIAGGAFPKDLSGFEKHTRNIIKRYDYLLWKELLKYLHRKPSFGDYTTQHPIYMPPISMSNPSASFRYTYYEEWIIDRGEGLMNPKGQGFNQYPALASLVVNQKEFMGADFSAGDNYIATIASNIEKTGNPKTWLQAGINHHMTLAADQVASVV